MAAVPSADLCPLCLEPLAAADAVSLRGCGCTFCSGCLRRMIEVNVAGHTLPRLRCPASHNAAIGRDEVKRLAPPATFLAYARQRHETAVQTDPGRVFCPRRDCGAVCRVAGGPAARPVRCVHCGLKFCGCCQERWPGAGHRCPKDLPLADVDSEKAPGPTRVSVRRCPKCAVPMMREEGCPQMRCPRCGHSFCWQCLADLSRDPMLHHFERGACRQPASQVWGHRVQSALAVCGLGCLALLAGPVLVLCVPCCILLGADLFSGLAGFDRDSADSDAGAGGKAWDPGAFGDETDDEPDAGDLRAPAQ